MNYKKILLINEGIKMFGESGFEDLRIRVLEKRAGIRKGSFFEFFDTTEKFAKECYLYLVDKVLESNTEYISKLEEGLSFEEISRKVWFNTIGWWLNEMDAFYFFQKFRLTKYYIDDPEFIMTASKPYTEFSDVGQENGLIKPMPTEFLYELVISQIMNTVFYIQKYPKLISDKEFLATSFDSLWDSIKYQEVGALVESE